MDGISKAVNSLTENLLPTASTAQDEDVTKSHHRHHTSFPLLSTQTTASALETTFSQASTVSTSPHSIPTKSQVTETPSASSSISSTVSSTSAMSTTSISSTSSSQAPSSSATVPANPLGSSTSASPTTQATSAGGSGISKAGIAIGVILSLVVFGAMGFLVYRQRKRLLACIARQRRQKHRDDEETSALKRQDAIGEATAYSKQPLKAGGSESGTKLKTTEREPLASVGASLDGPFSDPAIPETSNSPRISPAVSPVSSRSPHSQVISPISQSQYKAWATPFKYTPYTYERPNSANSPGDISRSQMGPPGRVLPAYAKAKARGGIWEVDDPNHRLLDNASQPPPP